MEPGESSCFPSGACWPPGRSTSQHSRHRECSASACSPLGRLHQDLSTRSDKGFATSGTRTAATFRSNGDSPEPAMSPSATLRRSWCASRSTDRKSTRLNSSHTVISYAVFCLKKKKKTKEKKKQWKIKHRRT